MVRLDMLGATVLERDDGTAVRSILAQPKRFALLAYLAAPHPPTPRRRDTLVGLLWPEQDEQHARMNLRQALYQLRQSLGPGVLTGKGDEIVGVDPERLRCDVAVFQAALQDERLEDALAVYGGPLLEGLHLSEARAFERWIETERRRLRLAAVQAAWELAEGAERSGDAPSARRWAERSLELAPYDETLFRRYLELLARLGDRPTAVRAYDLFASRLADDLELEPSSETRELLRRIRKGRRPESEAVRRETRTVAVASGSDDRPGVTGRSAGSDAWPEPAWPLLGREEDWERLCEAWEAATEADRGPRLVVVTGEAGLGKTRLAEELLVQVGKRGIPAVRAKSYASEGPLAYAPIAEWLRSHALRDGVRGLDPVWLTEVARVLPELLSERPGLPRPEPLDEAWQRRRLYEALARAVLATDPPLLLVLDDLQWTDRETLSWLHYLLRFEVGSPFLLVGTARPEEITPGHPLEKLMVDLRHEEGLTEIALEPLDPDATAELGRRVAGQGGQAPDPSDLFRETEGNPLFVVESVRASLSDSEAAGEPGGGSAGDDERSLPGRVRAVIEGRLTRLSRPARELAELAATIGRQFTLEVLAAASDKGENALAEGLDELWRRRVIREQGRGAYDFSHDKLREVAYGLLGPARRRVLHGRVAEALQALHRENLDTVAARLAGHYDRASRPASALTFHELAAEVARRVYANEEAIAHLERALELLDEVDHGTEPYRRELSLQLALGEALASSRGWGAAEVREVYERAEVLSELVGTTDERARSLWGLQAFHLVRADPHEAHRVGARMLELAGDEDRLVLPARFTLGCSAQVMARFEAAARHLEEAVERYDPAAHHERGLAVGIHVGVFSYAFLSHALWFLGDAEGAMLRSRQALELGNELGDPFGRAIALDYAAILHQLRDDPRMTREHAARAAILCTEHGYPYYAAWARLLEGWAVSKLEDAERGLELMREGLDDIRATGGLLRWPYYLGLLADVSARLGRVQEALDLVEEALRRTERTDERWYESELRRLRDRLEALSAARGPGSTASGPCVSP